jgi:uncharacterized protein
MMLHLITESEWAAVQITGWIAPPSLEAEGFVHCTDGDEMMLGVANRFYRSFTELVLALTLDESRLSSAVVREPPSHPDGRPAEPDAPLFPHVYGPVEVAAVALVRRLVRDDDGVYVGYAEV